MLGKFVEGLLSLVSYANSSSALFRFYDIIILRSVALSILLGVELSRLVT